MKTIYLKLTVEKTGRKWIHAIGEFDWGKKKLKLLISEETKKSLPGDEIYGKFLLEEKFNRYMGYDEYELTLEKLLNEDNFLEEQEKYFQQQEIFKLKKRIADFLGYIENNLNEYQKPYWYEKGEDTVKECCKKIENLTNSEKTFIENTMQELSRLYEKYAKDLEVWEAKKEAEKKVREQEKNDSITFSCWPDNFGGEDYNEGSIIEIENKLYKVVSVRERFEEDSLSMGGEFDGQILQIVEASPNISQKEREEYFAKIERMKKQDEIFQQEKKEKEEKSKALLNLKEYIKKNGKPVHEGTKVEDIFENQEIINDSRTIYGDGEVITTGEIYTYFAIKNTMDGDDWSINTIDGFGYGYQIKTDEEIKKICQKIK